MAKPPSFVAPTLPGDEPNGSRGAGRLTQFGIAPVVRNHPAKKACKLHQKVGLAAKVIPEPVVGLTNWWDKHGDLRLMKSTH